MTNQAIICFASYPDGTAWWEAARRRMEIYAEKCSARFIHLSGSRYKTYQSVIDRGEWIANSVENFNRSIVLDADLIVSRDAPNIFEEYPLDDFLGLRMALDSKPGDIESSNRLPEIVALQAMFGPIGWTMKYHNAGVILCSASHHEVFRNWRVMPEGMWVDQSNINYRARMLGHTVYDLPPEWNRYCLNTGWENCDEGLCAVVASQPHIAHAAGHKDRGAAMMFLDGKIP